MSGNVRRLNKKSNITLFGQKASVMQYKAIFQMSYSIFFYDHKHGITLQTVIC